jgi:hypothetical protein
MKIEFCENKKLRSPSIFIENKGKFYRLDLNINRFFKRKSATSGYDTEEQIHDNDEYVELMEDLAAEYLDSFIKWSK